MMGRAGLVRLRAAGARPGAAVELSRKAGARAGIAPMELEAGARAGIAPVELKAGAPA
ncbi:hypothetical protein [Amycolatopsis sp. NPDC051102]|uniref:hypothetical protein n=1 Tax=Amycolatopsis sp. NPDC051102 TaxID=3155163 RepID=UPI00342D2751